MEDIVFVILLSSVVIATYWLSSYIKSGSPIFPVELTLPEPSNSNSEMIPEGFLYVFPFGIRLKGETL